MKLIGTILVSLGLSLGVYAEEKVPTKPAQDASSTTKQNDSVGNIPLEIEKAIKMPNGKDRLEVIKAAS